MIFDLSINLGNVLTIGAFVASGAFFLSSLKGTSKLLDLRLTALEKSNDNQSAQIEKLAGVLITLGKYEERFLRLEGMIDDLRHGRGIILPGGD